MESNDSPGIHDREEASDISGLPSGWRNASHLIYLHSHLVYSQFMAHNTQYLKRIEGNRVE